MWGVLPNLVQALLACTQYISLFGIAYTLGYLNYQTVIGRSPANVAFSFSYHEFVTT